MAKLIFGNKIPPMHLACSKDEIRMALNCVYISNGMAIATDAYVLVKYDLRDVFEEDVLKILEGKLIHRELWKLLSKLGSREFFVLDGAIYCLNNYVKIMVTFESHEYPKVDDVFNRAILSGSYTEKYEFSINPYKLQIVTDIFGYKERLVGIQLHRRENHIIVLTANVDCMAIVMPHDPCVTLEVPSKFIAF